MAPSAMMLRLHVFLRAGRGRDGRPSVTGAWTPQGSNLAIGMRTPRKIGRSAREPAVRQPGPGSRRLISGGSNREQHRRHPIAPPARAGRAAASRGRRPAGPRHPPWIRMKMPGGKVYTDLRARVRELGLHTVCESASCPNIGECWNRRSLTIMILGGICTRSCQFCDVPTGRPLPADPDEPERVADHAGRARPAPHGDHLRGSRRPARRRRRPLGGDHPRGQAPLARAWCSRC